MNRYVYRQTGRAAIANSDDGAPYFIGADGSGRWFLSWTPQPYSYYSNDGYGGPLQGSFVDGVVPAVNIRLQAGFIFSYAPGGFCRGYVDTTRPSAGAMTCSAGVDPYIAENWPELFGKGVNFAYEQANGTDSLAPESVIWTNAGFASNAFTALQGGSSACIATATGSPIFGQPIAPLNISEPLGAALPPMLTLIGLALEKNSDRIAGSFSHDGVAFTFSKPQGDSRIMGLTMAAADGSCSGSIQWTLSTRAMEATIAQRFTRHGINGTLTSTVSIPAADGAAPPVGKVSSDVTATLPGNAKTSMQMTSTNGVIETLVLTNTAASGSVKAYSYSASAAAVTINGTSQLNNVASVIAAQPLSLGDLLDVGTLPIAAFMGGLPDSRIWPGQTAIVESWTKEDWTDPQNGEEGSTYTSNWGFGSTPENGLAQYNVSVNVDANGTPVTYSLVGQIYNQPGSVTGKANGVISCTVDLKANTTECFIDMQSPANEILGIGGGTPPGVDPAALIVLNLNSKRSADGSVTTTYNGNVVNPDGSSTTATTATNDGYTYTVRDASGISSTGKILVYADGTSTITISTTDSSGNGTYETIAVGADGSLISDTTTQLGNGGIIVSGGAEDDGAIAGGGGESSGGGSAGSVAEGGDPGASDPGAS